MCVGERESMSMHYDVRLLLFFLPSMQYKETGYGCRHESDG